MAVRFYIQPELELLIKALDLKVEARWVNKLAENSHDRFRESRRLPHGGFGSFLILPMTHYINTQGGMVNLAEVTYENLPNDIQKRYWLPILFCLKYQNEIFSEIDLAKGPSMTRLDAYLTNSLPLIVENLTSALFSYLYKEEIVKKNHHENQRWRALAEEGLHSFLLSD